MSQKITLIVYPVKDIENAKKFYNTYLGVEPYTDSPYYVGYKVGDLEVGLDPNSKVGPISYTVVDDISASLHALVEAGGEIIQDVKEVGGGLSIAQIKDIKGNVVGLQQESK